MKRTQYKVALLHASQSFCPVLVYPRPYLRTINTFACGTSTIQSRVIARFPVVLSRSSVSSSLPKDYRYAVKRTQYKVALLHASQSFCPVLVYPRPYLRTINTFACGTSTIQSRVIARFPVVLSRSSVSSSLPKDYRYAVKRTQYKVALLHASQSFCSVLVYPRPYLRTINTFACGTSTIQSRVIARFPVVLSRSSVSSSLPKDYRYAVKRTQYKVALLHASQSFCPVLVYPRPYLRTINTFACGTSTIQSRVIARFPVVLSRSSVSSSLPKDYQYVCMWNEHNTKSRYCTLPSRFVPF